MPKFKETDDFVVDLREKKPSQQQNNLPQQTVEFKNKTRSSSSWLHFVQYNNGFLAVLIIGVMLFSGLALASEEVRENTIGSKQVYAEGIDNTLLLETDLDNFSMDFTITGIIEDEESYLITYSYVDLILEEGSWQIRERNGGRKIAKPFRRDLGLYLADQLSQEAKARLKELNKIKKEELTRGETKVVQVTKYSGLIGKVLDISAKAFPNYEPVKKVELETPEIDAHVIQRANSGADNLADVYNDWVDNHQEEVAEMNEDENSEFKIKNDESDKNDELIIENEESNTSEIVENIEDSEDVDVEEEPTPEDAMATDAGELVEEEIITKPAGQTEITEPAPQVEQPAELEPTPEPELESEKSN